MNENKTKQIYRETPVYVYRDFPVMSTGISPVISSGKSLWHLYQKKRNCPCRDLNPGLLGESQVSYPLDQEGLVKMLKDFLIYVSNFYLQNPCTIPVDENPCRFPVQKKTLYNPCTWKSLYNPLYIKLPVQFTFFHIQGIPCKYYWESL